MHIESIHLLYTLLGLMSAIGGILIWILRVATKGLNELKAHKVAMKELLTDLGKRNPEALARIITAMDQKSVVDFIQEHQKVTA